MKKTHNINIGNSIVHIEEDAYELLTVYMNEVKQHFARNTDDFEIVKDIENRIAEMFAEMLAAQQKQVVSIADVQTVIRQMGSVKDFESSEEAEGNYAASAEYDPVKKLYRDTDHAMIAGVCAGLAHYLDVNVKWIRVFAFLIIFLFGSGILAYVIFWIMVPKASTRFERMSMYGEEPTLRGFANSQHPLVKQSRGFIAEFFEVLANFLQGSGKVILKVIAVGIAIFGSMVILGLIVAIAALFGFWDASVFTYFPLNVINQEYIPAIFLAFFTVLGIPVLALVLFAIRVAFNGRAVNKTLSFGLLIIWLTGVVFSIFYVAKISSEFKEHAEFTQVSEFKPYKVYTLEINRSRFFTKEDSLKYRIDPKDYKGRRILNDLDGPFDIPRNIKLKIERSDDGKVTLIQNYKSQGKTFEMALQHAKNIQYNYLQQDSLLTFSPMLQLNPGMNWRAQEVELLLKVPVGTVLNIRREFEWYLAGYDYGRCNEAARGDQYNEWIMTTSGLDCKNPPAASKQED